MESGLRTLLIVCPLIFLGSFVDSIAGGGGIITIPAYLLAGLPVHFAYGTNKFSASTGALFSAARFIKNKQVHLKSSIISVVLALLGSALGARAALALDEKYLQYCLIIMLPVIAVFVMTKRDFGENVNAHMLTEKKLMILSSLSGLIIGAYDGFFGPGAGMFLVLANSSLMGFNLTMASGNARVVNLASNLAALVTYMWNGKVLFWVAVPAAIFSILGNWVGSGLAIKNGAKIIKPIFLIVVGLLFIKVGYDIFK